MRLEEQLRQSQKMEAIGRLAGGVAHDFNNVLTAIIGYAELAAKRPGADAARQDIEQIRRAANRAASLTGQLLAFSRRQPLKPRPLDLSLTVSETAAMLRRLVGEHISLVIENDEPLGMVMADPGQISQVVMNLAVNARDAMAQGGTLRISTRNVDLAVRAEEHEDGEVPAGSYVTVAVSDTGVGMDPETRARIFEPFFTTKERGTGLGLATVYGIVNQSGGHVTVHCQRGGGTRFTVYLPRAAALPGEDDAAVPDPPPAPRAAGTILLVEDEEQVRDLATAALGDLGYLVLSTRNGAEALAVLATHRERIDLLLTDVVMQGQLGGIEVAEHVRRARPEVKVLFMSGYVGESLKSMPGALLAKPFSSRELADEVRKAIGENQADQATPT
jgi:CheY-like chemotaxis protein